MVQAAVRPASADQVAVEIAAAVPPAVGVALLRPVGRRDVRVSADRGIVFKPERVLVAGRSKLDGVPGKVNNNSMRYKKKGKGNNAISELRWKEKRNKKKEYSTKRERKKDVVGRKRKKEN